MDISDVYEDIYLHKECKKVTIFLICFDVHANRAPIDGKITYRHYTMGSFLPAFKDDVGFENERHTICIENDRTLRFGNTNRRPFSKTYRILDRP